MGGGEKMKYTKPVVIRAAFSETSKNDGCAPCRGK